MLCTLELIVGAGCWRAMHTACVHAIQLLLNFVSVTVSLPVYLRMLLPRPVFCKHYQGCRSPTFCGGPVVVNRQVCQFF